MSGTRQVSVILVLLGFLIMEVRSRNSTSSAISAHYCLRVTEAPAKVFQVVQSTEKKNTESFGTISASLRERLRKKSGYTVEPMDCSNNSMLVQASIRESGRSISVDLRACPSVRNLVLQLRSLGFIQRKPHRRRLITCSRFHDTVVFHKPSQKQVVHIMSVASRKTGEVYSIAWNYETEKDNKSFEWFYTVQDDTTGETSVKTDMDIPDVQINGCENRFSSVRFGKAQCKHMECEYLLTYRFVNHTMLVIELSGKSDGWVALRLSSDQQMGADEVIACKRKSSLGQDLEAMSGWISLPHSRPKKKSAGNLQLVKQKYGNGYMYCKMVQSISLNDVGGDTSLDLTAKWFQMYAKGQIDSGGTMLQHTEVPPVTTEQISMLVPFQVSVGAYRSQSVKVPDQQRHSKCEGDAKGARQAAPRLDSYYHTLVIILLLIWKFDP
ncbi:hypothetical protein EGW08_002268 [Elysia chlorotica]|uniref:DOMON domain-containing protein n=1 Tax=Elysia chlorotica TaxID=188477 RepID=A0A433U855_ELYCH|nr:hypothetical protein EGW08_002268 [Elysia chlorotica]